MLVIPTRPIANQALQVQLDSQPAQFNIYQTTYGLLVDVLLGGSLIIGGVLALNRNRIVRSTYLGFRGDVAFVDTQGEADPIYTGLNSRWFFVYLDEGEAAAGVADQEA